MARFSSKFKGVNLFIVVLCLLVLGGLAVLLRNYQNVNSGSGASAAAFVPQNAAGTLVKKGSAQFNKDCGKDAQAYYALINSSKCTLLVVNGTIADPLIGKTVMATGALNDDAFYASSLKPQ